jgi:ATP-binding cassette, subfamily B, bacterial PglK
MSNNIIKKYLSIFNFLISSEKKSAAIIFVNGFINLIFDLVSIGLIIPIIYSIINNKKFNIPFIENFELNLYTSLSIFFFVIVIKNIYYYYNSRLLLKFCKNLYERISTGLLQSQLNTSYLEYLKLGYSDFSRSILLEVNYLVGFYRGIIMFVIHTFILVGIIFFLFYYNFSASLSLIVFYLIFLFLPSIFIYKKIDRLAKERKFLDGNKIYISNHIFQNLSIIKLYNKELFFVDFFKKANHGQQDNIFQISKIQLLPKIFVELTTLLFLTLMISLNIYFEITLEKMILGISVYLFAAVRLMPSIHEIMSSLQNVRYFYNSFVSVNNKINKKEIIQQKLGTKTLNFNLKNNIIVKDLNFKYPNEEKKIITNLNFEVKKNTLFGIHGESGSGKSTLINLILGLINPESGQIKCDDIDISKNINSWQDLISYVPSSYLLLNSELKKNVAYGEKIFEINETHVVSALKNAQLYMSQNKLDPNFFIEEDGKNLSAGQIQRVCISRAFYRNTPILILDEPTSNLDKENSHKIISLIKSIKDLTTIIVSHDHNIIKMCDDSVKLN